jgi:uncharacterized protein YcnI
MRLKTLAALVLLTLPTLADAHVSITPRMSTHGATEKYTVRIPSEGKVATVAAEMDVPEGVIVEVLQSPMGWKHEVKRANDRIVSVVWQVNVPPGEFVDVAFVARNPREGTRIVWGLRQRFADGTSENWTVDAKGQTRPTAVTQLNAPR